MWKDTNGKGDGKVYDAEVIKIGADGEGTIRVQWIKDGKRTKSWSCL